MTSTAKGIRLRKAPVDAALAEVDRALAEIATELETLQRRVVRLESQWDGEAREAFSTAMADSRRALLDLHRIGAALNRVARESVTRFDEFDRKRSSAWTL